MGDRSVDGMGQRNTYLGGWGGRAGQASENYMEAKTMTPRKFPFPAPIPGHTHTPARAKTGQGLPALGG